MEIPAYSDSRLAAAYLARQEVFTWTNGVTGQSVHFAVSKLRDYLERANAQVAVVPFPIDFAETLRVVNDVDPARALALPVAALRKLPIVLLEQLPEGDLSAIVIDGSHRLWRTLQTTPVLPERSCRLVGVLAVPLEFALEYFQVDPAEVAIMEEVGVLIPAGPPGYDKAEHRKRAETLEPRGAGLQTCARALLPARSRGPQPSIHTNEPGADRSHATPQVELLQLQAQCLIAAEAARDRGSRDVAEVVRRLRRMAAAHRQTRRETGQGRPPVELMHARFEA